MRWVYVFTTNLIQESGRCARGDDIGECILFYSTIDTQVINQLTNTPLLPFQVTAYAEKKTYCRRILLMHPIVSIDDKATLQENLCTKTSDEDAHFDVSANPKTFEVLDEASVLADVRYIVDIVYQIQRKNATVYRTRNTIPAPRLEGGR